MRGSSIVWFVVIAALLHGARAVAQTPPAAVRVVPAPDVRAVQGTVFDSLAKRPLAGASVSLVAVDNLTLGVRTAIADSAGKFAIEDVAPGIYLIGFLHPLLDSLGIEPLTRRISVPPVGRGSIRANLAVPSARTVHDAVCQKPTSRSDSTGALIGHLSDATSGEPVTTGTVTAQWSVITFANGKLSRSIPSLRVTPSMAGWFAFCGLPASTLIAVQATRGIDSTAIVMLEAAPLGLIRRELFIGATETVTIAPDSTSRPDSVRIAPERVHRGAGRITGIVRDAASGKPLPGVQVSVEGTGLSAMANDDGRFALSGLPLGTQVLVARKVGYLPDERPVNLLAEAPAHAEPSLLTVKSVLDTVKIVGRRIFDADRNGFERRRKTGMGHYFGAEQVEQFHPFDTSDLFLRVPSVRVQWTGFDKTVVMRGVFGGSCVPAMYIDGAPYRFFSASDLDNMVHPDRIAGIEVYDSPVQVPPEYSNPFSNCGSIVVWTKR
jgi:hypothetical protein